MENNRKIIVGINLIFIILLVIAIAIAISSGISVGDKNALKTTVDDNIASVISEQNDIDLSKNTIREIGKSGGYIAAEIFSTDASDFGNNATVILKKENDSYKTIYIGTGYGAEDFIDLGVPSDLANLIEKNSSDFAEVISESNLNPRNKYALIGDLPVVTDDLYVDYYFNDNLKDEDGVSIPIIIISGTDAAERMNALNKIRNFGYDIGYYPVFFENFDNPFPVVNPEWEKTIEEDVSEEDLDSDIEDNEDEEAP